MLRRLIAFGGHAPALWLLYRETLGRELWFPNLFAALSTVAAMLAAGLVGAQQTGVASPGLWVFGAWLAGHVMWGLYLAIRLPEPAGPRRD